MYISSFFLLLRLSHCTRQLGNLKVMTSHGSKSKMLSERKEILKGSTDTCKTCLSTVIKYSCCIASHLSLTRCEMDSCCALALSGNVKITNSPAGDRSSPPPAVYSGQKQIEERVRRPVCRVAVRRQCDSGAPDQGFHETSNSQRRGKKEVPKIMN